MPVGCNDGPDGAHRLIDPAHRLTIAAFKLAATGPCRIKFGRKPRSIDVEDMNLLARRTAPAGVTESLLQDGIERVERIDHTFDGLIEAARAARHAFWSGHILAASDLVAFPSAPLLNLTVIVNRASTQTLGSALSSAQLVWSAGVPPALASADGTPARPLPRVSLTQRPYMLISRRQDGGVAPGSRARRSLSLATISAF